MDSKRLDAGRDERERCIAILEAYRQNLGESHYVWLWNRMNNPEHDPRELGPGDDIIGYHFPKKRAARKKRKP